MVYDRIPNVGKGLSLQNFVNAGSIPAPVSNRDFAIIDKGKIGRGIVYTFPPFLKIIILLSNKLLFSVF